MKLIIAGSRSLTVTNEDIDDAVALFDVRPTEVISGAQRNLDPAEAKGIDLCGEEWAESRRIPVARYPALWNQEGKKAGPLRNRRMAAVADALLLIWDGKSKGSKSMLEEANRRQLKVLQIRIEG